ncbi:hypothetical protein BJ994_000363 [Arthrobacter pigmenti]|uniref:Antitoxin Xre/MbcA/ParS-like toxin-binding domain-containing protein n=1 Tax=Arthrobacter pigmenti TaxID=271432 RepID=A0A846RMC8_9MICC|nr:hypothetical protein [Arthrobacter pigmenti]NJC21287.1 hypothetical protein [Arthrobacter pigmenti]
MKSGSARVTLEATAHPEAHSRSVRAACARWRAIELEFGLLSAAEVDLLLGPGWPPAGCLAAERRILGVATKAGRVLYPGFQFDREARTVRPVIAEVARISLSAGWKDRHILQWLCAPNGYLHGERPVDVLDDREHLLAAANADLEALW